MKRFALVAAALAMAAPAFGQVDKKVEKELQASYKTLVAQLKKKDISGVMNHMTADATLTENNHKMTRAEFETVLKSQIHMMDLQSSSIKFTKLTAKNGIAKGEYVETAKAKITPPGGKVSLMESVTRYRATFKKVGKVWKLHSSANVGQPKMTMDGQPFDPTAPPAGGPGARP